MMLPDLEEALRTVESPEAGIRAAVEVISASNPRYHWTGVYLLKGGELALAWEIGLPTPHTRISLDKGICGAAARQRETVVVNDVRSDPRYLACSLETRSEIVVPLLGEAGGVLGEIDIDSDEAAAFGEADRSALEEAARRLARFLEACDGRPAGRDGPNRSEVRRPGEGRP